MSAKILGTEKNVVTMELTIAAEDFTAAINQAYQKNKKYFAETVPCVKIEYVIDSNLEKNQYTIKEDIENESSRNRHR